MLRFGVNPIALWKTIVGIPFFIKDIFLFNKQKYKSNERHYFSFGLPFPVLDERFTESGSTKGHYFNQDLFVAQRIFEKNPDIHLDIGSRVDGFVAHVASFRKIEVLDIRAKEKIINNISFKKANLMNLDKNLINYCDSLSCLHTLEHFGLGRYNDPIDFEGHLSGLNNMHKILKKGGVFYLSVPIGRQRIEFNAHRVFSVKYLLKIFMDKYTLKNFSYVDDSGNLYKNVEINDEDITRNYNCDYGCGIFEMIKK